MNIIKKRDKKIDEVLGLFIEKNSSIHKGLSTLRIDEIYSQLVGPTIAKYTEKVYLNNKGQLFLYITSAPLKVELTHQKLQLIKLLNENLGMEVVKELKIK